MEKRVAIFIPVLMLGALAISLSGCGCGCPCCGCKDKAKEAGQVKGVVENRDKNSCCDCKACAQNSCVCQKSCQKESCGCGCEEKKCECSCCCCCEKKGSSAQAARASVTKVKISGEKAMIENLVKHKSNSGLEWQVIKEGNGQSPKAGQTVVVHYTGWLNEDGNCGKKFDSSVDRGYPFEFIIGVGQVIRGWDEGVISMKKGEKRRIFIPSGLAYGARGAGNVIKPNADLIFDVELFDFR